MDISSIIDESITSLTNLKKKEDEIRHISKIMTETILKGNKILICGNGGSAAQAQHMSSELTGKFNKIRPGLPAISLTTDTSAITAIGNDFSFKQIFARQIKAIGREEDLLIAFTTSGNSQNILQAVKTAKERKITTIAICGIYTSQLRPLCGHVLSVTARGTPRIQEVHMVVSHLLCQLVDDYLFPEKH